MTKDERISQLEATLCYLWGAMLGAAHASNDPHVQAVYRLADAECRRTGLIVVPGVKFTKVA